MEALVRVGGLRGFGSIPALLRRVEQGGWHEGQLSLFEWQGETNDDDWDLKTRVAAQEELLGLGVDAHPLELVADKIASAGAVSTLKASALVGQSVRVAGLRQISHRSQTGKGETMMFMTLEDLEGLLDVVFFPDVYRRVSGLLSGTQPFLVTGVIEEDRERGEPLLRAERVSRF